jgi:hypothetical protein
VDPHSSKLTIEILPQPNDMTCGPTCLHAVYRYYGDTISLGQVIDEIKPLKGGGTLAVLLACHALERGYQATIFTYNLDVFDPSWFGDRKVDLAGRLRSQAKVKRSAKLRFATKAYLRFLELGGRIRFKELNPDLIRRYLNRGHPVLTGLSATYLFGCARERGKEKLYYDDVRGEPAGHFVVLYGYDPDSREALVADPFQDNPRFGTHYYSVGIQRLLGAVLLGALTYDANLLVIQPGTNQP